jgi:hypothetical protein
MPILQATKPRADLKASSSISIEKVSVLDQRIGDLSPIEIGGADCSLIKIHWFSVFLRREIGPVAAVIQWVNEAALVAVAPVWVTICGKWMKQACTRALVS